jgi:D-arabinose 1-dehydrogenase-like Zn-dependent alcohol dehydrogenase
VPGRLGAVLSAHDAYVQFAGQAQRQGPVTYGGYSDSIVVDDHFVLRVPSNLSLAGAAPLLCAGITTYSPMRHWGAAKGKKVGVVGLGGLGHMAVKFAHAFGAHVVVFTTSPGKKEDALRLGADEVVVSRNANEMQSTRRASISFWTQSRPSMTSTPTSTCLPLTEILPWWALRQSRCRWPRLVSS